MSISDADRAVLLAARRDLVDLVRACIDEHGRPRKPQRAALIAALRTLPDPKENFNALLNDESLPLPVPARVRFAPASAGAGNA